MWRGGCVSFDILGNYGFPNVDVGIWTVTGGGLPGSQLFSQTFAPAQFVSAVSTVFGTVVVTVDPTALVLSSDTYDISFFNRGGVQTLGVPGYSGGSGMLYDQGYSFISGQSAGFNLSGSATPAAVPLHPSIVSELIGLGLFGLLAWRRKVAAGRHTKISSHPMAKVVVDADARRRGSRNTSYQNPQY
jgi:hypothetical protein